MIIVLFVWERSVDSQVSKGADFVNICGHCSTIPAVAEARWRLRSWGLHTDLAKALETDLALSPPSPSGSSALSRGSETCAASSPSE